MKLLKKAAALVTALAVWVTSLAGLELTSITASASSVHIWDGTADTSWYTGDKESYDIYTPEQLAGLAKLTNEMPERCWDGVMFNLMNDLVLNDTANWQNWEKEPPKNIWTPIGNYVYSFSSIDHSFTGGFNGNGHTIYGLYSKSPKLGLGNYGRAGLFDFISGALICDLKIEKSAVIGVGRGPAGVLAAQSTSCYIKNVEISDVIVGCSQAAGGLIGAYHHTDITVFALTFLFAAAGILINPLYTGEQIKTFKGTVIDSCKVANGTFIRDEAETYDTCDHSNGCMVGTMDGGAVLNSITENCTFNFNRRYHVSYGAIVGAIGGIFEETKYKIDNCYSYNIQINKPNAKLYDKDIVQMLSAEEYLSPELVTKLGDGFVKLPNCTPVIASLKNAALNETIIPGDFDNSGKLTITDVAGVLKACLNDTALDYRTFLAADMDGSGKLEMTDVSLALKKCLNS